MNMFHGRWSCQECAFKGISFCHLVAVLSTNRNEHQWAKVCVRVSLSVSFPPSAETQAHCQSLANTLSSSWPSIAAEHLQSEGNVCHPQRHSSEWNFTLGETTTRRATGFPMTPLAITKNLSLISVSAADITVKTKLTDLSVSLQISRNAHLSGLSVRLWITEIIL